MEKEENVGIQHFLLFPQCFQRAASDLLKHGIVRFKKNLLAAVFYNFSSMFL